MIVDANTLMIHGLELTKSTVGDASVPPAPLDQVSSEGKIPNVTVDGAYDTFECRKAIMDHGAEPTVPPGVNAVERERGTPEIIARDAAIRGINEHGPKD